MHSTTPPSCMNNMHPATEHKADSEVAVVQYGIALELASMALRNDTEIALVAVVQNGDIAWFIRMSPMREVARAKPACSAVT